MRKQGINGDLITEYREKNKLTQAKFASRLNKKLNENGVEATYSDKAISMWENGNRQPADINVVKAIAKTIGVSLDELCFMNEEHKNEGKSMSESEQTEKIKEKLYNYLTENEGKIFKSLALGMYNCAQTTQEIKTDVNSLETTKEFWLAVPFEPHNTFDAAWALDYEFDDGYEAFEEFINGAELINDRVEFRTLVLDYLIDNTSILRREFGPESQGVLSVTYADVRFDADFHRDYYYMVLSDELRCLGIEIKDMSVDVVNTYYTDRGMLLRMQVTLTADATNIIGLVACGFVDILSDAEKWKEVNKKSVKELLKIE